MSEISIPKRLRGPKEEGSINNFVCKMIITGRIAENEGGAAFLSALRKVRDKNRLPKSRKIG